MLFLVLKIKADFLKFILQELSLFILKGHEAFLDLNKYCFVGPLAKTTLGIVKVADLWCIDLMHGWVFHYKLKLASFVLLSMALDSSFDFLHCWHLFKCNYMIFGSFSIHTLVYLSATWGFYYKIVEERNNLWEQDRTGENASQQWNLTR